MSEFDDFEKLKQDFFPGSKQRIPTPDIKINKPKPENDAWDAKPRVFNVRGVPTEFFGIGSLAKALNRESVTIRLWERQGIIPKAQFKTKDPNGLGGRRLYTREQIEGMVKIAGEEGILEETWRSVTQTKFKERVLALFHALSTQEK